MFGEHRYPRSKIALIQWDPISQHYLAIYVDPNAPWNIYLPWLNQNGTFIAGCQKPVRILQKPPEEKAKEKVGSIFERLHPRKLTNEELEIHHLKMYFL